MEKRIGYNPLILVRDFRSFSSITFLKLARETESETRYVIIKNNNNYRSVATLNETSNFKEKKKIKFKNSIPPLEKSS